VCTEPEVDAGGCFTGRIAWPLATARERSPPVRIAERECRADEPTFYSDSITDRRRSSGVKTPIAVNPDARLHAGRASRLARVERW
jgi:phosphoserine phosphatase